MNDEALLLRLQSVEARIVALEARISEIRGDNDRINRILVAADAGSNVQYGLSNLATPRLPYVAGRNECSNPDADK